MPGPRSPRGTQRSPRPGLRRATGEEGELKLLIDALDTLEKLASEQPEDRPVGLVIDEFQKLVEAGPSSEAQIRAAIQRHARVGYVFAGSKTRLLTDMATDASRSFYRPGSPLFIAEIPQDDFRQFLTSKFAAGGRSIKRKAPGSWMTRNCIRR